MLSLSEITDPIEASDGNSRGLAARKQMGEFQPMIRARGYSTNEQCAQQEVFEPKSIRVTAAYRRLCATTMNRP